MKWIYSLESLKFAWIGVINMIYLRYCIAVQCSAVQCEKHLCMMLFACLFESKDTRRRRPPQNRRYLIVFSSWEKNCPDTRMEGRRDEIRVIQLHSVRTHQFRSRSFCSHTQHTAHGHYSCARARAASAHLWIHKYRYTFISANIESIFSYNFLFHVWAQVYGWQVD